MITFIPVKNSLNKLHNAFCLLISKYPRLYLAVVSLLALVGYVYVLAFPLVTLISLANILQAVASGIADNWHQILTWTSMLILSGIVTYRAARLKIAPPSGLTLSEDKAPELFGQVRVLHARYKRPDIPRIVITPRYEVDIIKTPRWVLPIWSSNTIVVIGLPVLQSLSPQQLDCMVARRIGQFSKRDNLLTNWLYQLRQAWQQILTATARNKATGIEPLRWFFALYTPLYSGVSAYAASLDELHADYYAMQLYNDQEVLDMVTSDALCRWYLEKRYWPAVYKISAAGKVLPAPHSKMASAIRTNLKGDKLLILIREMLQHQPRWNEPLPSFKSRIENIGHDKPRVPDFSGETAGTHYLGKSMDGIITVIDKSWRTALINKVKRQRRQREFRAAGSQASSA